MEIVDMTCPNCLGPVKPVGRGYGQCEYCKAKFKLAIDEKDDLPEDEDYDEEDDDDEDYDDEDYDDDDDDDGDFDVEEAVAEYIGSRDCPNLDSMGDVWYGARLDNDGSKRKAAERFLGVPRDEEIILLLDNTLFHNGKKGFAICEGGIYLRDEDGDVDSYTWDEFFDADVRPQEGTRPSIDDYFFICDGKSSEGMIGLLEFLQDY